MKPRPRIQHWVSLPPNPLPGIRVVAIRTDGRRFQRTFRGSLVTADWSTRSVLSFLQKAA